MRKLKNLHRLMETSMTYQEKVTYNEFSSIHSSDKSVKKSKEVLQ